MAPPLQPGVLRKEVVEQDHLRSRTVRVQREASGVQERSDPSRATAQSEKRCQVSSVYVAGICR